MADTIRPEWNKRNRTCGNCNKKVSVYSSIQVEFHTKEWLRSCYSNPWGDTILNGRICKKCARELLKVVKSHCPEFVYDG